MACRPSRNIALGSAGRWPASSVAGQRPAPRRGLNARRAVPSGGRPAGAALLEHVTVDAGGGDQVDAQVLLLAGHGGVRIGHAPLRFHRVRVGLLGLPALEQRAAAQGILQLFGEAGEPCEWKDRSGSLPRALDGSGRLMWYCAGMKFSLKCGKTGTTAVESMCRFRPWPALIRTDAAHRRSLR